MKRTRPRSSVPTSWPLLAFEKLAALQGWNSKDYHIYLGSLLALQIYVSLADDILKDYSQLKDALLKAYNVDADSYRKKFKESKVGDTETYVQLITRMTQYLDHWLIMSSVEREYNSLFDFLIQDQLLSNCPLDLRIFLKERTFASTVEMAQTADGYRCAHRAVGHIRPSCPELKFAKPKTSQKVNAAFKANVNYDHGITCDGSLNGKPVNVLFDSGCSSVIVKESLVPASVKRGKVVALYDYLGERREFPTARCLIRSKFLNGWFDVVVAPIKFTDVLIGMVPGVKASSVNIPNTKAAKTPQRSEINAVATRAAKAKENVGPDKLIVPSFKFENVSKQDFMDAQSSCPSLEHIRSKERIKAIVTVKSRHFSHRKTAEKVFHKFFWPGAGAEIKRYCRSCHACQKTVPKGKIRKAPMVQMPVISEPFSRVAIDIVGPISPPSSRGHKYMLTLIDMATRFPEAVPLRNIDSVTVAEALLTIFARVGIPKEILSDRGTQFKSDLMAEINRLLSVKALYTSPYHACCNGTVERFHAVLKAMLKKLCSERPHDWDRYIPSVLFAYREIPHDTLKFSPFELLYGRKVRGPLSILHNLWTKDIDGEVKSTYQYVLDLRSRLEQSAQLASAHADVNSRMYKTYFDRKARARTLKEGDEVLVLLPTSHNKLTVQWKGPYSVVRKHENGVDYEIKIKGKIRLYHVNMLKKYERRENGISHSQVCQACVVDASDPIDKNANGVCDIPELYNPGKYEFNFNSELSNEQTSELNHLIADFLDVFVDKPGMTSTVVHDIHLTTEVPVHTKPYPIPYHLRNAFDEEVERMRELRVIEPSTSAYCSPVVLVKKADNSWRFCVDFRSPNDISLFDAEPMPTMEEALGSFVGDSYFTEIDLCKGYWQIPLSDKAKQYTAFATQKYGLMQFRKLPFGLRTACATFIRLMPSSTGLKDLLMNAPILTLPDYSKTFYLRTDASDTGLGPSCCKVSMASSCPSPTQVENLKIGRLVTLSLNEKVSVLSYSALDITLTLL
ncbi:uncharacterized protein LOC119571692 [Penaeus monodon]|uniref:uncharacterized protein LOC119571692 n=1 Tax=Penaeus monodon TaxID=6687 RepID=UPI0018A6FD5B|nr:uncharacterized protein LOC119571692 [Penaeus monodon]